MRSALEYAGDGASSADVRQQALGFLEEWKQEKEVCRRAMAMGGMAVRAACARLRGDFDRFRVDSGVNGCAEWTARLVFARERLWQAVAACAARGGNERSVFQLFRGRRRRARSAAAVPLPRGPFGPFSPEWRLTALLLSLCDCAC